MELWWWALWGLMGAFVYAAPRALVAVSENRLADKPLIPAFIELLIALAFGPIFSSGFGPWAAANLGRTADTEIRAVALVIGMVANPVAPLVVKVVTGELFRRLGGTGDPDR